MRRRDSLSHEKNRAQKKGPWPPHVSGSSVRLRYSVTRNLAFDNGWPIEKTPESLIPKGQIDIT
jgi:hypothetical protein